MFIVPLFSAGRSGPPGRTRTWGTSGTQGEGESNAKVILTTTSMTMMMMVMVMMMVVVMMMMTTMTIFLTWMMTIAVVRMSLV